MSQIVSRRRQFLARIETMEQRSLLAVTPIHMISGANETLPVKYIFTPDTASTPIVLSGYYSTQLSTDIAGKPVDFNKDGKNDLLVLTGGVNEVIGYGQQSQVESASRIGQSQVALGTADSLFVLEGPFALAGLPGFGFMSAAVTDVNGDGYQDIVSFSSKNSTIQNYLWNPAINNFTVQANQQLSVPPVNMDAPGPLAMGDLNGDGLPDMIVPHYVALTAGVHAGNYAVGGYDIFLAKPEVGGAWNGQFETNVFLHLSVSTMETTYGESGTSWYAFPNVQAIARDLDNDGDIDLALPETNGISLWKNPGNGQFDPSAKVMVPSASNVPGLNLVADDFNNDGLIDIASSPNPSVLNTYGAISGNTNLWEAFVAPMSIYINQSTSAGLAMQTNPFAGVMNDIGQNGALSLGDFNLDGNVDLVISPSTPVNSAYAIALGDGIGNFLPIQVSGGFSPFGDPVAGNFYKRTVTSVVTGDFNGDGQLDVASLGTQVQPVNQGPGEDSNIFGMSLVGVSLNSTFSAPRLSESTLPDATEGVPYSQRLTATGGDSSLGYAFALDPASFALPTGLTLAPNGVISGTPTQTGTFQLLIRISQPNGLNGKSFVNLVVDPANVNPVVISPGALPNAVAGLNYQVQLSSTAGPSTWSITQGSLPAGLSLSSGGLISGLPQAIGNYSFQASAMGANGSTGQINYVLTVQAAAAPVVTRVSRYGYHAQPTVFVVSFSQPMDSRSASSLANYSLVMAGHDGVFGTRDDRNVALRSASYDSATNAVTLIPGQMNLPLHRQYRLTIDGQPNDGLRNVSGTYLGGQGVGAPGTNFVTTFGQEILAGPSQNPVARIRKRVPRPSRMMR